VRDIADGVSFSLVTERTLGDASIFRPERTAGQHVLPRNRQTGQEPAAVSDTIFGSDRRAANICGCFE